MSMQVQSASATLTAANSTRNLDLRAEASTIYGDTVTVAPTIRVMISTNVEIDLLVFYSRDGGATWIDRGTVDRLVPGVVHGFVLDTYGSDVRVQLRRVSADATVSYHVSTRPR